ncbi:Protein real-time [Cyphomyrmex costatus]|uniref:Protein real-time n=1 Tax=Cyphomyrmex costatus TaxID=456900 RepID=A0A195C305_9HYME|nr:Protein real-time [Cyphomyrmex costatus]
MSNMYDMRTVHMQKPRIQVDFVATTNPTKMNIIVSIIPAIVRNVMDFTLLMAGISLNACLSLFIVLNSTMHTSTNCYIVGLVLSNFVILLEPLERVLSWIFGIHLEMNLDYVFLMSFSTSVLTIILLNIETYVVVCQKRSHLLKPLLKISTAVKGILFIWAMCLMATAIELHLYDHFVKEITYDIYVSSTIMFVIFPCFIFVLLDYFILYDLIMLKSKTGMWSSKDMERFIFLEMQLSSDYIERYLGKLDMLQESKLVQLRHSIEELRGSSVPGYATLLRFLRATEFSVEKAREMLTQSLHWRKKHQIDKLLEEYEMPQVVKDYFPGGWHHFDKDENTRKKFIFYCGTDYQEQGPGGLSEYINQEFIPDFLGGSSEVRDNKHY